MMMACVFVLGFLVGVWTAGWGFPALLRWIVTEDRYYE
jgi:hypothetical protein